MRKVKRITSKEVLGYEFTTNDFVRFESDSKKSLLSVEDMSGASIVFDITLETSLMLSEFFRYIYTDLKEDNVLTNKKTS